MDIIIHCGLNKTGTSSLQHFLASNDKILRDHGVLYPNSGREAECHHGWSLSNIHHDHDQFNRLADGMFCERADEQRVVLSSEAFQDAGRIDLIRDAFRGARVSAVFYLRNYVEYFTSWWGEDVQSGTICEHATNFALMKQRFLFPILNRWHDALGRGNIMVLPYQHEVMIGGDVRCDFMKRVLDIDIASGEGWSITQEIHNPSISGNLLFLKRMINLFIQPDDLPALRDEFEILAQLKDSFLGLCHIEDKDIADIKALYEADRDSIAQEFGVIVPIAAATRRANRSPDLATLAEDLALIDGYARAHGFVLCRYLDTLTHLVPAKAPRR